MTTIFIKRVYEPAEASDGFRVLVDRLWPRGLSKEKAAIDHWAKELAPSNELRQWFGHQPDRWEAFRHRYLTELESEAVREELTSLRRYMREGKTTLLYDALDDAHNNAVVLRDFLRKRH